MSARSKARKRALDILFEADVRGVGVLEILTARRAQADPPVSEYAEGLVRGVVEHWREINDWIGRHAEGWTMERMPPVDRNILRIAVLELLWRPDVPPRVVIDEAVELAKNLSTDRSPSFVNGLLGSLVDAGAASATAESAVPAVEEVSVAGRPAPPGPDAGPGQES
ncbi:transcription antitermination factor NusB [Candidatus Frankia alpina]|uniref:transcription antitermination factor NusB n=1 Tax=Candidatus Frankia alpina TaxID=2699483 RepID=UPI0013D1E8A9|nr:transcription antitermination factor NusB [Candidatus Frankia alpina]